MSVSFSVLLHSVRSADQDYEFYPTSDRMIQVVARRLDKSQHDVSILDIGAGDGRVLRQLSQTFDRPATLKLYAIEKSPLLVEAQSEEVVPVGTDLFEQNLACLPVSYIFCNPPYSQYESWTSLVVESGHARKAFLVIPQRWKDDPTITLSLKKRGATARVLHSDDFYDAPRSARAVVDIVEVTYPLKSESYGGYRGEVRDPFDIWFDEHVSSSLFEQAEDAAATADTDYERERREIARIRRLDSISEMVAAYQEEYSRMEQNYRAIFQLDSQILRELGVNKETVRDGIKLKMAGLKSKYWLALFDRLDPVTNRLSTATKTKFTERLTGNVAVAFTSSNAYAIVLWAIKNANQYIEQQTVALYRDLSTFEGVSNYKSNLRTWARNDWRYYRHDEDSRRPTHYALDYRIVVEKYQAIFSADFGLYDYPGNLHRHCHDLISDAVAVLFNLGFPSSSPRSIDRDWYSGQWQDWYRTGNRTEILFQVKAHKNGNLHFRFLPEAIRSLNVTAGRLMGWLCTAQDVQAELGYSAEESLTIFSRAQRIALSTAKLLLSSSNDIYGEEQNLCDD